MGYGPGSMKVYAETALKKRADAQSAWQRNLLEATANAQKEAYQKYTADESLAEISEFAIDIDALNVQSEELTSKIFERLNIGSQTATDRLSKTEKYLAASASKGPITAEQYRNLNRRLIAARKKNLSQMQKNIDEFSRSDVSEFKVDAPDITYKDPITGEVKTAGQGSYVEQFDPTNRYQQLTAEFDEMFEQKRIDIQEDFTKGFKSVEEMFGQTYEDAPEGTGYSRDLDRIKMRSNFRKLEQRERGRALASVFGTEGFAPWKRTRIGGIGDPEAFYVDDNTLRRATGMDADERFKLDYEFAQQQYAKSKQRSEQAVVEAKAAASSTAAQAAQVAQESLDKQREDLEQTYEEQMQSQITERTEEQEEKIAAEGQQIKRTEADLRQRLREFQQSKSRRTKQRARRVARIQDRTNRPS
tara:strand:- start:84 stop:1334 length:1251 start_codon:yes stop_codon:yes gene_type:complete